MASCFSISPLRLIILLRAGSAPRAQPDVKTGRYFRDAADAREQCRFFPEPRGELRASLRRAADRGFIGVEAIAGAAYYARDTHYCREVMSRLTPTPAPYEPADDQPPRAFTPHLSAITINDDATNA